MCPRAIAFRQAFVTALNHAMSQGPSPAVLEESRTLTLRTVIVKGNTDGNSSTWQIILGNEIFIAYLRNKYYISSQEEYHDVGGFFLFVALEGAIKPPSCPLAAATPPG